MTTAGEVIKNKRESLGKSLTTISADTKIQKRYLEYIESNQFDRFDSEIFASGFLKIYSKYLDLDVDKILALYRRDANLDTKIPKKGNLKTQKEKFKISPKLIAIITLSIFLLSIVGYIGYQIYKFQKPPVLTVSQPLNEYVSDTDTILVKGVTETSSVVNINNEKIKVNDKGEFEYEFKLAEGVNSITVKAWKTTNTNLDTTITLKVIYKPKKETISQEQTKDFVLLLTISQSPSWIKLDVDGENKISQVLQPNTQHEYKILNSFTLVTGRVQNTSLKVNNDDILISSSDTTGIGQVTCNIENNELKCE
jgi:cytoskeletal protein RodZ